jgi:5'-methylthioadenosine phosphorylase
MTDEASRRGWHIGVIGGSGLASGIGLADEQQIAVSSPFGEPSGTVTLGTLAGVRFAFLARHGAGHRLPPGEIDYRANIDVLRRCGVTDVLALSAIGSLREELAPGQFVAADQFIDHTHGRQRSFFGPGLVGHVGMAEPVCPRLAGFAVAAAEAAGATVHRRGCYIAIDGPQFSTRAESRLYRQWGADVVGMTAMPEARLAREAGLPYAILGMVTDWDSWREDQQAVEAHDVIAVMTANAGLARAALVKLAELLPAEREPSPIEGLAARAILTAPDERDRVLAAKLGLAD